MKSFKLAIISSLFCLLFLNGCRQIFGDGEQLESIVQAFSESSQIIVTAPLRGSIWKPVGPFKIIWMTVSIKKKNIQLYKKSAYQFIILENIQNSGSFDWSIPVDINLSIQYLVKIINHNYPDTYQFSGRFGIE